MLAVSLPLSAPRSPVSAATRSLSPSCMMLFVQLADQLSSALVDGLCDMRYLNYVSSADIQRTKHLFHDVLQKQKKAIHRLLKDANGTEELADLIDPVMDVMRPLLSQGAEAKRLQEDEKAQLGLRECVVPHQRSLGKVATTVKVRPSLTHNFSPPYFSLFASILHRFHVMLFLVLSRWSASVESPRSTRPSCMRFPWSRACKDSCFWMQTLLASLWIGGICLNHRKGYMQVCKMARWLATILSWVGRVRRASLHA